MFRSRTPPSSTPGRPYGLLRSLRPHKPFHSTHVSPNQPDSIASPDLDSMVPWWRFLFFAALRPLMITVCLMGVWKTH